LITLQKWLLWKLGSHYFTPIPFGKVPNAIAEVEEAGDTGGGWYRPTHRKQDPSVDPREPGGGESSGAGNDHGWSNCTMASAAMALDFDTLGAKKVWGGDMRHHQSDLSGGTDLYDAADAFAAYGNSLTIRTGAGWEALKADRDAGRFLIVQGQGNVPGSESFDGGHACVVGPETNSEGKWLFGDPLASGWQWCSASSIQDWMNNFHSGYAWARTDAHKPASNPEPPDDTTGTPQLPPAPGYSVGYDAGVRDGRARTLDEAFASWLHVPVQYDWDDSKWDKAGWGVVPIPLDLLTQARHADGWGKAVWAGATWS